jgi:hypothetical protein
MDARVSTLQFLTRRLLIWLLAVVVTYVLASLTATQAVIAELAGMGVVVPPADRAVMSLQDILGMANMFLPMVAFALLVAFMTSPGRGRRRLHLPVPDSAPGHRLKRQHDWTRPYPGAIIQLPSGHINRP